MTGSSYHRFGGLAVANRTFHVPLDAGVPDGERLRVFGREIVACGRERDTLPWLVFLQGGPGFPSPRPTSRSGWLDRALEEYRVLLLDQRGTGRSTPATYQTLSSSPDPERQARWLNHFRADAIVQDCEAIRSELLGEEAWSVLGQSFGGFCAVHYLSVAPHGLREVFITGGLPPLDAHVDDVYRRTYVHLRGKNERYFERYPEDRERLGELLEHLDRHDVRLPDGDRLTPRRFQQIGIHLGMSDGFEPIHYLLEDWCHGGECSYAFLRGFQNLLAYDVQPIYTVLHEACYAQGFATRWSAERILDEYPAFRWRAGAEPLLTGEMLYPWMLDEIRTLRPLKDAAEQLAQKSDWPRLYDREVLAQNNVPVAAAIYADDLYVDRDYSEETARAVHGLRSWLTNEYEHNGLRAEGKKVLTRLIDLARERV